MPIRIRRSKFGLKALWASAVVASSLLSLQLETSDRFRLRDVSYIVVEAHMLISGQTERFRILPRSTKDA
jgi:hypothetical protein